MVIHKHADQLKRAADVIQKAKALIITAGAGMSVDSGLPDFRGPEGLWRAYPPLKKLGLVLEEMSTPKWFHTDPEFAWGFFGHRYNMYKRTEPHLGYQILQKWAANMKHEYFVFTSNVDGHFQKSGFTKDRIVECHGSINYMQCVSNEAPPTIWPIPEDTKFDVDMTTLRAAKPLPMGPPHNNQHLARPNILLFDDWEWQSSRTDDQYHRYYRFIESLNKPSLPVAVIEIGAGLAVPTIRYTSEGLLSKCTHKATLIRINPNEAMVPDGHISIPLKGLEALQKIDELLKN